jgi:hypothetical protein
MQKASELKRGESDKLEACSAQLVGGDYGQKCRLLSHSTGWSRANTTASRDTDPQDGMQRMLAGETRGIAGDGNRGEPHIHEGVMIGK